MKKQIKRVIPKIVNKEIYISYIITLFMVGLIITIHRGWITDSSLNRIANISTIIATLLVYFRSISNTNVAINKTITFKINLTFNVFILIFACILFVYPRQELKIIPSQPNQPSSPSTTTPPSTPPVRPHTTPPQTPHETPSVSPRTNPEAPQATIPETPPVKQQTTPPDTTNTIVLQFEISRVIDSPEIFVDGEFKSSSNKCLVDVKEGIHEIKITYKNKLRQSFTFTKKINVTEDMTLFVESTEFEY